MEKTVDRLQKEQLVEEFSGFFNEAQSVVIAHYKGLTVSEITELRLKARELNVNIRVTKNSLVRRALEGTPYEELQSQFSGQALMAWSSEDPVSAAKVIHKFAKDNDKLVIQGGAMLDEGLLDEAGVKALAAIPSLNELRAKMAATIQAPAKKLALVFKAYSEKEEGDAA